MADNILTCPHCSGQIKAIPLRALASQTVSTFESVSSHINPPTIKTAPKPTKYFWNSDFARGLLLLGGVPLVGANIAWLGGHPTYYGAVIGTAGAVAIGSCLAVTKWYFERPTTTATKPPPPRATTVRIEHLSDDKRHWLLNELNPALTLELLRSVAEQITAGANFSRYGLRSVLSQNKWHILKDDFLKLDYCKPLPNGRNGYELTFRGRQFLRKINTLSPSKT